MPDYRTIATRVDRLPVPKESEWLKLWEERGQAVRARLGETTPPGMVHSFSWKEYLLPGACAMTFANVPPDNDYLYMTLGLTQGLASKGLGLPWEFSVRTAHHCEWPIDLLYQLLTQWHWEHGQMGFGYYIPLRFVEDRAGNTQAYLTDDTKSFHVIGAMRGLYLWIDERRIKFRVSSGDFGVLAAVPVTEDEDCMAQETTPAHLMLLFRRMGIKQVCDPDRLSAMTLRGATAEWKSIQKLSHDDALSELSPPNAR